MKKKRAASKRVRRDPFVRALETAKVRLERAIADLEKYEEKVQTLKLIIPQFQKIVRAFEGDTQPVLMETPTPRRPRMPVNTAIEIPAHLERFVQPRDPEPELSGSDEDAFLPDPKGEPVLE